MLIGPSTGERERTNLVAEIPANLNNFRQKKNKTNKIRKKQSSQQQSAVGIRHLKSLQQTLEYANLNKIIKNRKFEFPKRGTQLAGLAGIKVAQVRRTITATSGRLESLLGQSFWSLVLTWPGQMPVRQSAPHSNGPSVVCLWWLVVVVLVLVVVVPTGADVLCPKCTTLPLWLCPATPILCPSTSSSVFSICSVRFVSFWFAFSFSVFGQLLGPGFFFP